MCRLAELALSEVEVQADEDGLRELQLTLRRVQVVLREQRERESVLVAVADAILVQVVLEQLAQLVHGVLEAVLHARVGHDQFAVDVDQLLAPVQHVRPRVGRAVVLVGLDDELVGGRLEALVEREAHCRLLLQLLGEVELGQAVLQLVVLGERTLDVLGDLVQAGRLVDDGVDDGGLLELDAGDLGLAGLDHLLETLRVDELVGRDLDDPFLGVGRRHGSDGGGHRMSLLRLVKDLERSTGCRLFMGGKVNIGWNAKNTQLLTLAEKSYAVKH